ncbi:hypothetical protein HUN92_13735 [Bacillus firmus]|nr:hypothetical protein [Cytobacillus firmus]NUH84781.1 hypothetical protein [Cytobacillus firmus]
MDWFESTARLPEKDFEREIELLSKGGHNNTVNTLLVTRKMLETQDKEK